MRGAIVGSMFIQMFDGVLASYVCGYSSLCVLQTACGRGVALEHNGDVYSCDHYVDNKHLLGNVRETTIEKLITSEKQHASGTSKSKRDRSSLAKDNRIAEMILGRDSAAVEAFLNAIQPPDHTFDMITSIHCTMNELRFLKIGFS